MILLITLILELESQEDETLEFKDGDDGGIEEREVEEVEEDVGRMREEETRLIEWGCCLGL